MSATYGPAAKPAASANVAPGSYGDQEEMVAQWQDSQYRFDLIRLSYGPTFRLVGVMKKLEAPAQAATLEAKLLDDRKRLNGKPPVWQVKQMRRKPSWKRRGL
jgi:hypothetical protein